MFANEVTDTGLISKISSTCSSLSKKRKKKSKWTKVLNSYFSKEDIQTTKTAHENILDITNY